MIHQRIYIEDYGNWLVDIYYGVTHFEVDEIMENLYDIGCDSMSARRAYEYHFGRFEYRSDLLCQ